MQDELATSIALALIMLLPKTLAQMVLFDTREVLLFDTVPETRVPMGSFRCSSGQR